jgi:hypothetical protein
VSTSRPRKAGPAVNAKLDRPASRPTARAPLAACNGYELFFMDQRPAAKHDERHDREEDSCR